MALKKNTKPTAEAAAVMNGDFEDDATTQGVATQADAAPAAAAPADAAPTTEQAAAAGVTATTAIAKAQASAVATPAGDVFGAHLSPVIKQMLASVEWGELPRVIASQGALSVANEDTDLGRFIEGQILQVQDSFICSPGDDSDEAKKLVKYSKDGVMLDDGSMTCAAYIEQMVGEGYDDAALKHYGNLTLLLEAAEDEDAAEELVGTVVVVQLSPESRKRFKRYLINATLKASMTGSLAGLDHVKLSAVKKSGNGRQWTEVETSVKR